MIFHDWRGSYEEHEEHKGKKRGTRGETQEKSLNQQDPVTHVLETQRVIEDSNATEDDTKGLLREEVLRGLPVMGS